MPKSITNQPARQNLRLKILLPMSIGLLIFLGLYTASTSWYLNREIYRDLHSKINVIDQRLQDLLDQRSKVMNAQLQQFAENPILQQLMTARDRSGILQASEQRFKQLREEMQISHFYFHTPDKVVFLRVHNPPRYGDRITRSTLQQAAQTGLATHGIELGSSGTFSLRTVIPWRKEGKLLGYLELGQEIKLLLNRFFEQEKTALFLTIDKQHLVREQWETGIRILGKTTDWNQFTNKVVIQMSNPAMLPALRETLEMDSIHPAHTIKVEFSGNQYLGLSLPLKDATRQNIGEFLVLHDVTADLTDYSNAVKLFIILCLILGGGCLFFTSLVLGKTETQLASTQKKLLDEMQKVQQTNLQLGNEIEERKAAQTALNLAHDELEARVQERTEQLWLSLEQTRQAREQLAGVVTSVADGLLVTNLDGTLQLINASAEELFDCTAEECTGEPLGTIIKDSVLRKRMQEALNRQRADLRIEFTQMSQDLQKPVFMLARTSVVSGKHGEPAGMIFLFQDISYERENERMKSEFISTAVHELSTPLTAIMGYSELLLSGQEFSPEDSQEFLTIINEKADFLSGLVGEMLDISRIESGRPLELRQKEHSVEELFERPIHHFKYFSANHQFSVSIKSPELKLPCDKEKIWQVMENLCSNAVKYSPGGGEIEVSGTPVEQGYQMTVSDQGIGMTKEQLSRVFEKFYRCNQSDTSVGGTGLGMTIVKSIIDAHDGRVWLESELGQGTRVHFILPHAGLLVMTQPPIPGSQTA